ncbi:MAG: hypothetical protein JST86_18720 [Bacteroidetes bacterium]|nr:hypothetical protein [Bacteroidota bacterium]
MTNTTFEITSWYDTWNATGYNNLLTKQVPLQYATRYNLAFASLEQINDSEGYTIVFPGKFAADVKTQIQTQAPGARIYAGLGDDGLPETVADNNQNNNRSTGNIIQWLLNNGFNGISIDAEEGGKSSVLAFIKQIGPGFQAKGLGIAVSAPWPIIGPESLYGSDAVAVFNQYASAIELQDYSSDGTPEDAAVWIQAGIKPSLLIGGICTENSNVQTPLTDVTSWTQWAMQNGLGGMFSWRLDNDHGMDGEKEDQQPTFTGAKALWDAANS